MIDLDIKGFFDNLDHDLVMKAVRHHDKTPWVLLYIERWLKAPVQRQDGSQQERTKGSPQGAVVSPLLANLFLHHFETPRLARLLALVARRTRAFVACEPRRSALALAGARALGVIGCNDDGG